MPRQSLDMPHSKCSQVTRKWGGFLPVSVPEWLSFFSWDREQWILFKFCLQGVSSRICVAFKSRQDNKWTDKQETGTLGLDPPSFAFWFPSPICQLTFTLEFSSSCYNIPQYFLAASSGKRG